MAYVSNLIHSKKTNYLNNFPGNETDSDELGKFAHANAIENVYPVLEDSKIDTC